MKINFKSFIAAALVALVLTSCTDENIEKNSAGSVKTITAVENPFEEVGVSHNEILNDFASHYDPSSYTLDDLYQYNISHGMIDSTTTISEFDEATMDNGKLAMMYILQDSNVAYNLSSDFEVSFYFGRLRNIFRNIIENNQPYTVEEFSDQVKLIEADILALNLHNYGEEDLNKYSMLLSSLAVARYSYEFWYNAYYDSENPWHDMVISNVNSVGAKMSCPEYLTSIWNGIMSVGKAAIAIIGFVPADIYGAFVGGYNGYQQETRDLYHPNYPYVSPYMPPSTPITTHTWSWGGMVNGAASTSMDVWHWGFDTK